jgi:hypothetical protein
VDDAFIAPALARPRQKGADVKCSAGWTIRILAATTMMLTGAVHADAQPKGETYAFKVLGTVSYRCYGGYGPVKAVDSRTKVVCDNETKKQTLVSEAVKVTIKAEPNPDDSNDMYGDWSKDFQFAGRKFTALLSLSKAVDAPSRTPYRLTVDAYDDEPSHRRTSTSADAAQVKELNALSVRYSSMGQPEEIEYNLSVTPVQ